MSQFKLLVIVLVLNFGLGAWAGNGGNNNPPPPAVLPEDAGGLVPLRGQTGVVLNTLIQIGFTQSLSESIDRSKFFLVDEDGDLVDIDVFDYGFYGIIRPSEELIQNTRYRVTFDSVMDDRLDRIWEFTTGSGRESGTPTVVTFRPPDFSFDVSTNLSVEIDFDRDMDPTSFDTNSFRVLKPDFLGGRPDEFVQADGTIEYDFQERVLRFFPMDEFPYGAEIIVELDSRLIRDFYGNPLLDDLTFEFETIATGGLTFNSLNGTRFFYVPEGVDRITVIFEGGQGGEGSGCGIFAGGSGRGGERRVRSFDAFPGAEIRIVIGEGGDGGSTTRVEDGDRGEETVASSVLFGGNNVIRADGGRGGSAGSRGCTSSQVNGGSDGDRGFFRIEW